MLYILIAIGLFAIDWKIKSYVEQNHKIGHRRDILNGKVTLKKQYNKGFCLNIGDDRVDIVKKVSAVVFAILIFAFLLVIPQKNKCLKKLGLSMAVGGAASNVFERFKKGYVVDYFSINFKSLKNIVFNLADIFIFIGCGIIFLFSLFSGKQDSHNI